MVKIIQQTVLNTTQKAQIFELWNNEYPEKLAYLSMSDFENYLNELLNQNHYLYFDEDKKIRGWAFTFVRENEVWFAIIISTTIQRKGIGKQLLNELKSNETTLNGWVIDHNSDKKLNGEIYFSPLEFYSKNDFQIIKETRLELDFISAVKIKWETLTTK